MAYATGVATSIEDLMQQMHDFAVAQGWSSDIFNTTNDWCALNNGTTFVQFRWDNTNGFAPFHSRGFTGTGTAPGNQAGDDGCPTVDASAPYNAAITANRCVTTGGNGPFVRHHFFTNGTTQYVYCVLEFAPNIFRHWGFGQIDKIGDWVGGSFCYGHFKGNTSWTGSSTMAVGGTPATSQLWFGTSGNSNNACASMHVEGMPGQAGTSVWGLFRNLVAVSGTSPNDRAGNARVTLQAGAYNGNPWLCSFLNSPSDQGSGMVYLSPINIMWANYTPNPSEMIMLGTAPGQYMLQLTHFNIGDEFQIGANTYKVFPVVGKTETTVVDGTLHGGIAYLMVP